jgi:hypothetical protein
MLILHYKIIFTKFGKYQTKQDDKFSFEKKMHIWKKVFFGNKKPDTIIICELVVVKIYPETQSITTIKY